VEWVPFRISTLPEAVLSSVRELSLGLCPAVRAEFVQSIVAATVALRFVPGVQVNVVCLLVCPPTGKALGDSSERGDGVVESGAIVGLQDSLCHVEGRGNSLVQNGQLFFVIHLLLTGGEECTEWRI
jgi:hypothetical protein